MRQTSSKQITSLTLLLAASANAMAHPGHDHSLLSSNAIHVLTFLAIAGIVSITAYTIKKNGIPLGSRSNKRD